MRYIIGRSLKDLCRILFGVRYSRAEAPAEREKQCGYLKESNLGLRDYRMRIRVREVELM